jgi:hypothetical protein
VSETKPKPRLKSTGHRETPAKAPAAKTSPARTLPAEGLVEPAVEPDLDQADLDAEEDAAHHPLAGTSPVERRKANQAAQRAESQAAHAALEESIIASRRQALSTAIGISAVAALGLAAYGSIMAKASLLAAAVAPLLLVVCFLCWPRERALTRAEYLSLPHTRGRNARLRCIHCSSLGPDLAEVQAWHGRQAECPKCRKVLFRC